MAVILVRVDHVHSEERPRSVPCRELFPRALSDEMKEGRAFVVELETWRDGLSEHLRRGEFRDVDEKSLFGENDVVIGHAEAVKVRGFDGVPGANTADELGCHRGIRARGRGWTGDDVVWRL